MSRTYKATGINLKAMPLGEADRLLTILTREFGLVRAVAIGSRKHQSQLGGRSGLFVVNELLIAKGRSLDKVTQAETLESYPRLGHDLKKLTASQYLAELSLLQALSDQPQEDLFYLLNEHLKRLERSPSAQVLAHLTHAIFQLLVLAGIAPQIHCCAITREQLTPDLTDPDWRIGFSIPAGGAVTLAALEQLQAESKPVRRSLPAKPRMNSALPLVPSAAFKVAEASGAYAKPSQPLQLNFQITGAELVAMQALAQMDLPQLDAVVSFNSVNASEQLEQLWLSIERIFRQYAQFHFDHPIRSATLIDACFLPISPSFPLPES